MRIGVNLLPFRQRLAGTGRFTQNILRQLAEIDRDNTYFLFLTKESEPHFSIPQENFLRVICRFSPSRRLIRISWEQLILPQQLRRYRIDLLFTPSVAIPFWVPCPTVTVIHDMIPFQRAITKYSKIRSAYVRMATSWSIKRSTAIIAVSENTKREIIKFCQVPENKVFVSLEGVDSKYRQIDSLPLLAQVRAKYNLPERFILFVGTLEPGKNLLRLIEAFCQLKLKNRMVHKLVIVGAYGWGKNLKLLDANQEILRREIIFTGYVPEEDLPLLYNAAELFVFPSRYEGFGLPVLEAMACGTPVITSNLSSLPEIVGDAGLLINPDDTAEIANAIEKVLNDKNLQTEMQNKGLERIRRFSWQKSATVILNIFKIVGGQN